MADAPLAARMRPRTFEEFVGQTHVVGPGAALSKLVAGGNLPSIILWGPAGTGKTTLAHLLADAVGADMMRLSAVSSGVADARKVMEGAKGGLFRTVLFVDEVHRWSKAQQDVLLPAVEAGTVTLIGATTENPYFSLNTPLLSRCLLLRLEPLGPDELKTLMLRALDDPERGLGGIDVKVTDEALDHLAEIAGGDARMALTGLEAAVLAAQGSGEAEVTRDRAAEAVQRKAVVYDRQGDAHYDVISAFIKSIRGSDPDAALFWLARMLEAGEDARFIARRMIVHASEDIGLADPRALLDRVGRRPRRGARGAPRGAAEPRGSGDLPGPRSQVEQRLHGSGEGDGGRRERRRGPGAPPRFVLSGREASGARQGLQVPARLPRTPGRAGVPSGPLPGDEVLRTIGRGRGHLGGAFGRGASSGFPWVCYAATQARPTIDHEGDETMGYLALNAGDTALIILAAFWGLLVLFLCIVLLNTFRVLESTKMMIDSTREETVPLLREVRGSVERTNREIDRIDGILERVERVSGLVEQAAASPLVKIISVGAGLRKGASRFKKSKPKTPPAG